MIAHRGESTKIGQNLSFEAQNAKDLQKQLVLKNERHPRNKIAPVHTTRYAGTQRRRSTNSIGGAQKYAGRYLEREARSRTVQTTVQASSSIELTDTLSTVTLDSKFRRSSPNVRWAAVQKLSPVIATVMIVNLVTNSMPERMASKQHTMHEATRLSTSPPRSFSLALHEEKRRMSGR